MKKRLFGIILAAMTALFALTAFCVATSAASADAWDGVTVDTSWHNATDTEFTINTAAELAGLAAIVNSKTDNFSGDTITLGADIDLNGKLWTPIGVNYSSAFKGTFDGGSHTVSMLKIESTSQYVGMFGYIDGGAIKNLVLEAPSVTTTYSSANASVGALVGYHVGGNIELCGVRNGSVSAPNSTCAGNYSGLGGIVGCHNGSGFYVKNCYSYMTTVSTKGDTATRRGGVAGSAKKLAESCYTYNTNQRGIPVVGGAASGSFTYSAQYSAYLGNVGEECTKVTGTMYVSAFSDEQFADGTVAFFLRTGGYSNVDNPWGQDVEGDTKDSLPIWNGTDVYRMQYIKNVEGKGTVTTCFVNELEVKEIGGKEYRVIYDAYDWALFANLVNTNNGSAGYPNRVWNAIVEPKGATIDFSVFGTLAYHNGSWQKVVTIGATDAANGRYSGIFNGNGCTVTGLSYDGAAGYDNYALFKYTGADAHISGITVKNANIANKANTGRLATFAYNNKGTIENCHAENVTVSASGSSGYAAGIVYANSGIIKNCSFSGSVTGGVSAGGIVYELQGGGAVSLCANTGSVTGNTAASTSSNYAGGIAAYNAYAASIENCYNAGKITAHNAGGIAGKYYSSSTVKNTHNYGTVSGTKAYPMMPGGKAENCYYLADSETDTLSGTAYKTATEFKDGTVLDLLNGANTDKVWYAYVNYPILEEKEPPHLHTPLYSIVGTDTITAVCTDTACTESDLGSVTVSAPTGLTYGDSNEKTASVVGTIADAELLTVTYEYKKDADGTYAALNGTPENAGFYKASIKMLNGTTPVVAYVEYSIAKAAQDAPSAPEIENRTATSITLRAQNGCEYSLDGNVWYTENVFRGLSEAHEYTFFARRAGNDNHEPSAASVGAKITTAIKTLSASLAAPVKNAAPAEPTLSEGVKYTVSAKWTPEVTGKFLGETVYTAELVFTPVDGYEFDTNADVTVNGTAAEAELSGGKLLSEVTFDKTDKRTVEQLLSVDSAPDRVSYTYGDTFDPAGLVLSVRYDDNTEGELSYSENTNLFSLDMETVIRDRIGVKYAHDDSDYTYIPLTLGKKAAQITALPQELVYGDPVASGTDMITADGLVGEDTVTSVSVEAEVYGVTKKGSVIASSAVIENADGEDVTHFYDITYTAGRLVITAREDERRYPDIGLVLVLLKKLNCETEEAPTEDAPETQWKNPYLDVSVNDWYFEDVKYMTENEIMLGTGDGSLFSPEHTLTRAMVVTMLWRAEGSPVVNYLMQFADVPQDEWYSEAVRFAAASGIVFGYGDGLFRPDAPITREQLAAILHRYAIYKGADDGAVPPMIPAYNVSVWAEGDVVWADMKGLFEGIGVDMSDMTANATRAESAAILRRFFMRILAK